MTNRIHMPLLTVKEAKKQANAAGAETRWSSELREFADELMRKMKGYKVSPRAAQSNLAWVYREGDNYCMGEIGFGDFLKGGDGTKRYAVFSPQIFNGKYGHGRHLNMRVTTSLKQALKNCAALRPLSISQILQLSGDRCSSASRNVIDEARKVVKEVKKELLPSLFDTGEYGFGRPNALQAELKHLVETGYEFMNAEVGEKLNTFFNSMKELNATENSESEPFTFVEAISVFGKPKYRVAENIDVHKSTFSWGIDLDTEQVKVYSQEEVPHDILAKLSVLSMVQDEHYVAGVGYRFSENIFYIRNS